MVCSLQRGIIYGPVRSRRFGCSLGINLSPRRSTLCSFDCVYCP
jgi:wyosine [tRNA(Phe)-imidazoG37] synthetase (radical SAM superfamily)